MARALLHLRLSAGLKNLYPDVATIGRPSSTSTGAGHTTTWTAQAPTQPCRVSPASRRSNEELALGGRLAGLAGWDIALQGVVDVRGSDRLKVGSRTFDVVDVQGPHSIQAETVAVCVEVS